MKARTSCFGIATGTLFALAYSQAPLYNSNQNTYLQELEEILGRVVMVKGDPLLHQEKFDLA